MGMESAQELTSTLSDTSVPPFSPSYVCTVITDRHIADNSIASQMNRTEKEPSHLCPCSVAKRVSLAQMLQMM